jgi:hypothetical protein
MMAKARTIRFGVIGCGVIAYWAHLRTLKHLKNATLVAATDPDAGARERASRLVHVPLYEHPDEPAILLVSDYKCVCPIGSKLLPDGSLCTARWDEKVDPRSRMALSYR